MKKEFHLNAYEKEFGYSQAILNDKTLYVSGTVAADANGRLVAPNDMAGQMRAVYANLKRTLEANGTGFDEVVKETIYTTDMDALLKAADMRFEYYPKDQCRRSPGCRCSGSSIRLPRSRSRSLPSCPERLVSLGHDAQHDRQEIRARLAGLINSGQRTVLRGGRKGVEKESLRVTPDGVIFQAPHPAALGAPLTNENITTDFSEALIELVTPAFRESWELLQYLCDIHQFVYRHLDDQLLWSTSMPAAFAGDESIPLARFGRSNVGKMKTVYRHGLGMRYGRIMQAISGVHFNYSFPMDFWEALEAINESKQSRQDFISEQYFGVLRNYRRFGWLVLYLFGTSPAVSKGFFARTREQPPLRRRYRLRAVRHLAANERHRLSQQESSDGERLGQRPR